MLPGSMRSTVLLRHSGLAGFLSALALAVYWFLGDLALLALAVGLPVLVLVAVWSWPWPGSKAASDQVIDRLEAALHDRSEGSRQTGCFVVQFDDPSRICDRHGQTLQSEVLAACIGRIRGAMRPGDRLFPLEDGSLVVVLAPSQRLDLEGMVRIAGRMQLVVQQPMVVGDISVQLSCCIGFCHARQINAETGRALLEAAQIAADEAMRHSPGAIRAYTDDLALIRATRDRLRSGFAEAIYAGPIRAHFQPQVSTDSGEVKRMDAQASWRRPFRCAYAAARTIGSGPRPGLALLIAGHGAGERHPARVSLTHAAPPLPTAVFAPTFEDHVEPLAPLAANSAIVPAPGDVAAASVQPGCPGASRRCTRNGAKRR